MQPRLMPHYQQLSNGAAASMPMTMPYCSQVSDGASACLLMTRAEAQRRGLPVLGVFR